MEKPSPNQDGKRKKPTKMANVPVMVTNTEVMWLFGSFSTHAKDLYPGPKPVRRSNRNGKGVRHQE